MPVLPVQFWHLHVRIVPLPFLVGGGHSGSSGHSSSGFSQGQGGLPTSHRDSSKQSYVAYWLSLEFHSQFSGPDVKLSHSQQNTHCAFHTWHSHSHGSTSSQPPQML